MSSQRLDAVGRANLEAEEAEADTRCSLQEEADRLLAEHRERTKKLREEMKVGFNNMWYVLMNSSCGTSRLGIVGLVDETELVCLAIR